MSTRFESMEGKEIRSYEEVKVKRMNAIIEVMHIKNRNLGGLENVVKLTFKKIRDLINNNFAGAANELHITLTYAENMRDTKRLYEDFKNFMKRFRYRFKYDIDYLSVVEPQGRGAWHMHLLIRFNGLEKIFIPDAEICSLWGHGFTKTKSLEGIDNIGAYLSAYLGDVEMTKETIRDMFLNRHGDIEVKEVEVEGLTKKYIKGGRLHYYPPGMNIYRKSKGIKFPDEQYMRFADVKKMVGSAKPTYTRTVVIRDDSTNRVLNEITYQNYNLKRL